MTQTKGSPFVLPKTFDEVLLTIAYLAWPFMFFAWFTPPEDSNALADFVIYAGGLAVEIGIWAAMRNVRQHS